MRRVHELYFAPQHERFQPRTRWSLSNAFTSAFKELDSLPQFKATAKLGAYLGRVVGSASKYAYPRGWAILASFRGMAAMRRGIASRLAAHLIAQNPLTGSTLVWY